MKKIIILIGFLYTNLLFAIDSKVSQHLQEISVTIKAGNSQGSGVIFTREDKDKNKINVVWTAAHVVSSLRKEREVVTPSGTKRTLVEFDDPKIVKVLIEDGRTIGQVELDCQVIKYSDVDFGHDLALLIVRKKNFIKESVVFYLEDKIPELGTEIVHVGSLLGVGGANSLTTGVLSQKGRLIGKMVYDQFSCPAFPGCLTADTIISCGDGVEKRIIDLKNGDDVITIDTKIPLADGTWKSKINIGNYILSIQEKTGDNIMNLTNSDNRPVVKGKVINVWSTGIKPILKISTRNKTVRATANHPFLRIERIRSYNDKYYNIAQWCQAGDLKYGDIVGVMSEHVEFKKSQGLNLTHKFGDKENHIPMMMLLGFYLGDGYSRIRKGEGGEVALYTFNEEDSIKYTKILKTFDPSLDVKRSRSPSGEFLSIYSVKLASLMKDLGVTGYAQTKRIPDWVYQCPRKLQMAFLEGLIEADGHERRNFWQIELANEELIKDIQNLAINMGITTSNISMRDKTAILDGREIKSKGWSLEIYPNPLRGGSDILGDISLIPEGLRYESISSISPDGEEMTYDMEVSPHHVFFANGFLVHNSSGGGLYLTNGQYVSMLTRGAGETFTMGVPVRRIKEWCKKEGLEWAIDPKKPMPSFDEIESIPIEDKGKAINGADSKISK